MQGSIGQIETNATYMKALYIGSSLPTVAFLYYRSDEGMSAEDMSSAFMANPITYCGQLVGNSLAVEQGVILQITTRTTPDNGTKPLPAIGALTTTLFIRPENIGRCEFRRQAPLWCRYCPASIAHAH